MDMMPISEIVLSIKKLAARHQLGENEEYIKSVVSSLLSDLSKSIDPRPTQRVAFWDGLFNLLNESLIKTADHRWATIIRFAKAKSKTYWYTANKALKASHAFSRTHAR